MDNGYSLEMQRSGSFAKRFCIEVWLYGIIRDLLLAFAALKGIIPCFPFMLARGHGIKPIGYQADHCN